jgi:hypothetical protein
MEALWPELPEQCRPYEVLLTVPREDKGEPLVPREMPPEVLGCWSADTVTVSATVLASRRSRAVAAVEALVPELAEATGAAVTVRDAGTGPAGSSSNPGLRAVYPRNLRSHRGVTGLLCANSGNLGREFEWHGWATILASPGAEDDAAAEARQRAAEGRIARVIAGAAGVANETLDLRSANGCVHLWLAGSHNHRDETVTDLFRSIAKAAPGSYGVMYVLDDDVSYTWERCEYLATNWKRLAAEFKDDDFLIFLGFPKSDSYLEEYREPLRLGIGRM